jgi:hypothetical protein
VEADGEHADLEATIVALLEGQFSNPIRIIAFNSGTMGGRCFRGHCSRDAPPSDLQLRDVPSPVQDFVECHEGQRQLALRLV